MYSKKIYVTILSAILVLTSCQKLITEPASSDANTLTTDGVVHWGSEYNDKGLAVVQTADGGYGVIGSRYDKDNQEELSMVLFDANMDNTNEILFGGLGADSMYNNRANDLQQTSDGGYIMVGSTMNSSFNYDMWVVKYGPDLAIPSWEKTISSTEYNSYTGGSVTATYNDFGNSIQQTEDGSYIVCGTIYDGNDNDIALWKIDLNDTTDSLHLVYGENRDDGTCTNNATPPVAITPTILDSTSCLQNASTNIWTRVDNGVSDVGNYAQQTNDGGYIIVGSSFNDATAYDIRLIKLKSDFTVEFNELYEISAVSSYKDDEGLFVQQTSDNGYVVVGNYGGQGEGQVFILKTDYQGTELGRETYGSPQHPDVAACVRQTNDNGFVMVGSKYSQASTMEDVWVVKFSYDLAPEWNYTFGKEYSDFGTSINQTADGGYIVTGYSYSYPATRDKQSEVILIKLTADGIIEDKCITCAHQN